MKRHYPDLVSAYGQQKKIFHAARPIRSTNQIWVVTRHQYGISALVCTSFRRETSGSVAKCGLFSQAVAISKKQQTTRNCFTHPKCIFNNKTLPLFKEFNLLEDMFYQHKLFSLTFRLVNNKFQTFGMNSMFSPVLQCLFPYISLNFLVCKPLE